MVRASVAFQRIHPHANSYTFGAEMSDRMKPGKTISTRETLRITDADRHVMEMYEPRDGMQVNTVMVEYSRAK